MNQAKIALVSGAAGAIGFESALALGRCGTRLILLDRSEQVNEAAVTLCAKGMQAEAIVADLADLQQITDATTHILEQTGGIDILVNNAGIHPKVNGYIATFEEITVEDWERVFRINATAPFLLCQRFLGPMKKKKWGRIINISSRSARAYSERAGTHYSASKAALIGMTRKIAGDYAAFGITANCIAPGQIMTALARQSAPEVLAEAIRRIPAQRIGTAAEVASAVVYLSSEEASFVNGTVIDMNGGETMV